RDDRGGGGERPGPAITLPTESRGLRVAAIISDRGIGIEPRDLARLFDPYFTTKRGGTGPGLAIAETIVHALPGTLTLRTVPGRRREVREGRARADPRRRGDDARRRPPADPHDDGARDGREGHRGHEARRVRLPAEAVRGRRAARRRPAGPGASAVEHGAPLPA